MKGDRYATEDKILILREANRGERTIQAICQEANIPEVAFHRWKKQFRALEVNEVGGVRRFCHVCKEPLRDQSRSIFGLCITAFPLPASGQALEKTSTVAR